MTDGSQLTEGPQPHLGNIAVQTAGPVSQPERAYAVEKMTALARFSHEPILHARISLDASARPGAVPASAAASLDINGTPVRAHAEGTTLHEAIDLLQARLRTRLVRQEDRPRRSQEIRAGRHAQPAGEHDTRENTPGPVPE